MATEIVLTIIAPDRPGLVGQISDLVATHGGNWLESRMAHLAGSFAGILRLGISSQDEAALVSALSALEDVAIQIATTPSTLAASSATASPEPDGGTATGGTSCQLEVLGQDRPGIVRQISAALADRGVNVEELHTSIESAPMSGEPLFRAQANLKLPAGCNQSELQSVLEAIGEDLMVDVRID